MKINPTAENAELVIQLCDSELLTLRPQINAARLAGNPSLAATLDARKVRLLAWIAEAQAVLPEAA